MKTHSIAIKSLLLAVVLCLSILAIALFAGGTALAEENVAWIGQGSGTASDPYLVSNEAELDNIRHMKVAGQGNLAGLDIIPYCYRLVNDIDVTSEFIPLPTFTGNFNGGNHTITFRHLYANAVSLRGLFAEIRSGVVQDLNVNICGVNGTITHCGAICAKLYDGKIDNCHITGDMRFLSCNSPKSYIGSVCGCMYSGTINNCTSTLIISTYGNAGGIVGSMVDGLVSNSSFSGQIRFLYANNGKDVDEYHSVFNQSIGGICGYGVDGYIGGCSVTNECPVKYIGFTVIDNVNIHPRVGYILGTTRSVNWGNITVNPNSLNDPGLLTKDQAEHFKTAINSNCHAGMIL